MRKNGWVLFGNFYSYLILFLRLFEEDKRFVFDRDLSYFILLFMDEKNFVLKLFRIYESYVEEEEI